MSTESRKQNRSPGTLRRNLRQKQNQSRRRWSVENGEFSIAHFLVEEAEQAREFTEKNAKIYQGNKPECGLASLTFTSMWLVRLF
ncbi:MAG: hypothetical protein HKN25_11430 [Pyrinomonadaceae bacterium]|nr:hypothetical protein [Pyrinomonadaceae bacterium]